MPRGGGGGGGGGVVMHLMATQKMCNNRRDRVETCVLAVGEHRKDVRLAQPRATVVCLWGDRGNIQSHLTRTCIKFELSGFVTCDALSMRNHYSLCTSPQKDERKPYPLLNAIPRGTSQCGPMKRIEYYVI